MLTMKSRFTLAALLALAPLVVPQPARAQAPSAPPHRIVLPPNAPPVVSTSAQDRDLRSAETRLARFIVAIQQGARQRAAALLSKKVPAKERSAFLNRRWLTRTGKKSDFGQMLFLPDLQVRTRDFNKAHDRARLYVVPRAPLPKKKQGLTGYLEVWMLKENGNWMVYLRPDRLASNRL
jgi:hypothetical protein